MSYKKMLKELIEIAEDSGIRLEGYEKPGRKELKSSARAGKDMAKAIIRGPRETTPGEREHARKHGYTVAAMREPRETYENPAEILASGDEFLRQGRLADAVKRYGWALNEGAKDSVVYSRLLRVARKYEKDKGLHTSENRELMRSVMNKLKRNLESHV